MLCKSMVTYQTSTQLKDECRLYVYVSEAERCRKYAKKKKKLHISLNN